MHSRRTRSTRPTTDYLHGTTTLILIATAFLLSMAPGNPSYAADSRGKPNIVLILADDK